MEARNYIRPILVGLVCTGLVVLVVVLLVKAFSGGATPSNQVNVSKYADTDASVTVLADGPTNINQDHSQVKITVSATQNKIDIIQGYQGNVVQSQSYANNSVAFGAFLQTIQMLGFSKGISDPALKDYRGFCPTGVRYIYTFNNGQNNLFSYWSTSCGHEGTFRGNAPAILQQVSLQIPQADFGQLTASAPIPF